MHITFVAGYLDHDGAGSNISLDILGKTLCEWGHTVDIATLNISDSNTVLWETPYDVVPIRQSATETIDEPGELVERLHSLGDETDIFHVFDPIFVPLLGAYRRVGGETPVVARLNSYTLFCTNSAMMDGECHKQCTVSDRIAHDEAAGATQLLKLPQYVLSSSPQGGVLGSIDHYFAQSPSVKRVYTEAGFDGDKITTITNFYNPDFSDRDPGGHSFRRPEFNFLYVGRLTHIKGVDLLLHAVDQATATATVDIVGDGSARERLETKASTLSVTEQVTFHGWVDHERLPAYYSASDVFVHPGRWEEPSGRALLEAMQYHCPAIVSDIGGPPWIVGDAGLTFEPDDAAALADCIDRLVEDRELYRRLRDECRDRLDAFEPEALITEIEQQYERLVSQ